MKKDEILKILESEENETDFIFRRDAEEKLFLENHKKKVIEENVVPEINKTLDEYDDIIFKTLGKKKAGQKTSEFITKEFIALKEKADKVESLENEVENLKKNVPDDASKLKEIKSLQEKISKLTKDHELELSNFAKQTLKTSIKSDIQRSANAIKRKDGIPDSMWNAYLDTIANELSENAEVRDGQTIFLDKEGKALRNQQTMAYYSIDEIIKERLKDAIDEGRIIPGPGIKVDKIEKDKDGKPIIIRPPTVTSREKLGEYLVKELGLKRNSEDYMTAYAEYGKDLPAVEPKN